MINKGAQVTITDVPPGRSMPHTLIGAKGKVTDISKYGSGFFYEIKLKPSRDGFDKLQLIRESYLMVEQVEKEPEETQDADIKMQIHALKEELKAWPIPKRLAVNSDMYNRVWERRMRLHAKVSLLVQELGGNL